MKKITFENLNVCQQTDVSYLANKTLDEMTGQNFSFAHMAAFMEVMTERIGLLIPVHVGQISVSQGNTEEEGSAETNPQDEQKAMSRTEWDKINNQNSNG